ncbi:hypothetical protein OIE68_39790 [Nocardia vinacea]|uniref:hypothetical protein n=1 Tax=Nocardia vinacea TaxID=96468 RepID=UPI002E0D7A19|nr:hypothetical protein OIE68_39790 [Nocardia vinacea]
MSWREELARREAGLDEEVARLRRQIDELTDQLAAAELALSRLAITRETMAELLAEDEPTGNGVPGEADVSANIVAAQPVSGSGRAFGLVLVPQREAGMDASAVLPGDYCDILAILAEAGNGLRAGQVAAELGITVTDRSKVEALRSKLKRLVTRGWAAQAPSGVFTIAE